jgi:hypothetical protein
MAFMQVNFVIILLLLTYSTKKLVPVVPITDVLELLF